MPGGAHTLLSLLAEPLKQPTETLFTTDDQDVSDSLREFEDWVCSRSLLELFSANPIFSSYW